jgi:NADH-quinone oxidoreductase subunit M
MGPIVDEHHLHLSDATWNEKLAAIVLLVGIVTIGIAPFWLSDLIGPGVHGLMANIGRSILS